MSAGAHGTAPFDWGYETMRRGLVGIAGAAVVSGACFLLLKSAVDAGAAPTSVVLAASAATLVLAAASAGFGVMALLRARQAHAEIARLARSVETALRTATRNGEPISIGTPTVPAINGQPIATKMPALTYAEAVHASIVALAAAQPVERDAPNGHRH